MCNETLYKTLLKYWEIFHLGSVGGQVSAVFHVMLDVTKVSKFDVSLSGLFYRKLCVSQFSIQDEDMRSLGEIYGVKYIY